MYTQSIGGIDGTACFRERWSHMESVWTPYLEGQDINNYVVPTNLICIVLHLNTL